MPAILYYCLKVIICTGILYSYYLLALRNNRFHQWNRWYLLAMVVMSFTLPLLQIPLPWLFEKQPVWIYSGEGMTTTRLLFAKKDTGFHFTLPLAAAIAYGLVCCGLLVFFIKSIFSIQRLKETYPEEAIQNIHFYNTQEPGTPFSFFKNIFWNSTIELNTSKGRQMLRHEMAHVSEGHSVDKVFIQLLLVFACWNPFLYLIKKEITVIHEFIADQKASAGDDKLQYASLLLMKALGSRQFALGNPFFHSQLKRRLVMLTTIKNPRFSYIRRLMVLPLAALSLILFSFKYKEIKDKQKAALQNPATVTGEDEFYGDSTKTKLFIRLDRQYMGSAIESITPTADMSGIIVKTADDKQYFLDPAMALKQLNISVNDFSLTIPPGAVIVTGKKEIVVAKGAIISLSPHNAFPQYQYNIDTTAVGISGKSRAASSANKPVQDIHINDGSVIHMYDGSLTINKNGDPDNFDKALIIVDGVRIDMAKLHELDVKNYKSMNVLKGGEAAVAKYGEEGRNGVIIITTKQSNEMPDGALYFIDGKEATKENADALEKAKIKSVNVFKGESAVTKYGSKGQNGVIEITTTDQTPAWLNDKTLTIKDGKEVTQADVKGILNNGIPTSYTEMPPAVAMKTYGERGKNGAVILTTQLAKNEVTFPDDKTNNQLSERIVIGHKMKLSNSDSALHTNQQTNPQPADLKEVTVVGYKMKKTGDKVFTKVEKPASFPGGIDGWRRYLERNLKYPEAAQENGTQGTVNVQMTVAEDGNITELKALNDPGNGLAAEAERVISKGPKWIPATQNGHPVTYRFVQTLTFQLQ